MWDAGQARVYTYLPATTTPAGVTPFGAGCPGSGGFVPSIYATGGLPCLGNLFFPINLSQALGRTVRILVFGVSTTTWNGAPLPLDFGPFGVPGCSLLVSADLLLPGPTFGSGPGGGSATVTVPVPSLPALVGATVHFQWYVVDPGPLPAPGGLGRGLQVLIG